MNKVIHVSLNEASINKAIQEVKAYKRELKKKTLELVEAMCKRGEEYAIYHVADHVDSGETLASIVGYREGNKGYIRAGGAAVWLEFGTGVTYNGAAGTSPHPLGAEWGYTIGTYGEGHGADPNGWYYPTDDGGVAHTRGIPATLFMWHTKEELQDDIPALMKEVFGK